MSKLTRKTLILFALEAQYGVDAVPTADTNAILALNVTPDPAAAEFAARSIVTPYLGNSEELPSAIHSELDFDVELAGAGVAGTAPKWGPLLKACSFSETVTEGESVVYAPISDGAPSATIYYFLDGLFHKITGARGTVALSMTAKGIPTLQFKFTGLYSDVTDKAMPAGVDYSDFQKPVVFNKQNTPVWSFQGAATPLQALSIDLTNTVTYRNLVMQEQVDITDRKPTGSATLQLGTVAAKDWWAAVRDAVTGPLTITHGKVAGNIIQIYAPRVQATAPKYSDTDGVAMLGLTLTFVPQAGNDEITITVK
jgi:hypothetical protein